MKAISLGLCVLVLSGFVLTSSGSAQVQQFVPPVELYRFVVPGSNQGYLLTPYYSEGVNAGFIYQGPVGFIYVPALAGFPNTGGVPANSGLVPIHKWRVVQDGRLYFYYTSYYSQLGPDYTYQGILGYMYPGGLDSVTLSSPFGTQTYQLYKVKGCYSQSYGYYYGKLWPVNPPVYSLELPPTGTFDCTAYHGTVGGGIFTFRGTRPGGGVSESNPAPVQQDESTPGEWFVQIGDGGGGGGGGCRQSLPDRRPLQPDQRPDENSLPPIC